MNHLPCFLITSALLASSVSAGDTIAFSPNGKLLAIGLSNGSILLRDAKTAERAGALGKVAQAEPPSAINKTPNLCFSSDGRFLASASGDSRVALWDVVKQKKIADLPDPSVGYSLAFSPDGSRLAAFGMDGIAGPHRLTVWDTKSRKTVRSWTLGDGAPRATQTRICGVKFSQDGGVLIIDSVEEDVSIVRVWNAARATDLIKDTGHAWSISSVQ